jgi:serine/threonine-protein kinase
MGRILLAYDRDFRRRVAVKVLAVEHADRSRVARFLEEAQATAQLEHPNIAPVYDVGVERPGAPFFTMKWIRGKNLHEIVKTGRADYSLIQLVQILQQAAMGVHFAHSRGVIHRDLKPQNVMVGDYGEVLVVDWGLAKVLGRPQAAEEVDPARLVSTERAAQGEASLEGAIRGSPAYMAPEQAAGASDAIDARTDVYGLGCILYEILTGGPPHAGATAKVALGQARRGEVEPPSRRARGRDVPRELDAICLKALAPRQQDRFPECARVPRRAAALRRGHPRRGATCGGSRSPRSRGARAARAASKYGGGGDSAARRGGESPGGCRRPRA